MTNVSFGFFVKIISIPDEESFFRNVRRVHRFILCLNYNDVPVCFVTPPPSFLAVYCCIATFAVAEGWLLLDMG